MKIKISPSNYGVQQCTHSYAGYLGTPVILLTKSLFGSNNIFLYYLFQHMAFSLWDFSANITLPPSIPGLISIVTPSCHRVLPQGFSFFRKACFFPGMCQHHVRQSRRTSTNKFCPFLVFGYCHNIRNQPVSTAILSLNLFCVTRKGTPGTNHFGSLYKPVSWAGRSQFLLYRTKPSPWKKPFLNTRVTIHICQPTHYYNILPWWIQLLSILH